MVSEESFSNSLSGSQESLNPFRTRIAEPSAWLVLGGFLLVTLPLFLCKGLWPDVVSYLLSARDVLKGGILEQDVNNWLKPPTMSWVLIGVHWLIGLRSETIRFADFVFVATSVWILVQFIKPMGISRAGRIWSALLMFAFYFSTTEWCHCQPDTWMLIPALIALWLRQRQIDYLQGETVSLKGVALRSLVEGLFWGTACLFKPFMIVPGGLCWLVGATLASQRAPQASKRLIMDVLGLVMGGLFMGGLWVGWLWWGGGWSYFWMDFAIWGKDYYTESPNYFDRAKYVLAQFHYLGLLHLPAILLAIFAIGHAFFRSASVEGPVRGALLGGLYLGWLLQANFLQFQFDYHVAPTVLLALGLLAGFRWRLFCFPFGWFLMAGLLIFVGLMHPLLKKDRVVLWTRCLQEGSTPTLKDKLGLDGSYFQVWPSPDSPKIRWVKEKLGLDLRNYLGEGQGKDQSLPNWSALYRVEQFLRSKNIRNGDLTCYSYQTMYLYWALDVDPSTRYPFLGVVAYLQPGKQDLLIDELNSGHQRYVVTDLHELWNESDIPEDNPEKPQKLLEDYSPFIISAFPWAEPIIFRAGPYLVHEVSGPVKKLPDFKAFLDTQNHPQN
jgi:hypothetical protein